MISIVSISDQKLTSKCISIAHATGLMLTLILSLVVIILTGYDILILDGSFEKWWKSTDDRDTWECIYLWIVQLIMLKLTELIADIYHQAVNLIIIAPRMIIAYAVSVSAVMVINAALLVTLICCD